MTDLIEVETSRLKLRQWQKEDWPLFAQLNADPCVMKYFPRTLTEEESNRMADRIYFLIAERGWGLWAVEETKSCRFIGFVGLHEPALDLPFTPCVEIGWRLAKKYWGKGYATEAAKASLRVAFDRLSLSEVLAFTAQRNVRSRALMERLGMANCHQNFEHPAVPAGNLLREHVLYRLGREQWEARKGGGKGVAKGVADGNV